MALRFTTHGVIVLGGEYGSHMESNLSKHCANKHGASSRRTQRYGSTKAPEQDEIELTPDMFMHSAFAHCEPGDGEEETSVKSYDGSRQRYIRKKTEIAMVIDDAIQPVPRDSNSS